MDFAVQSPSSTRPVTQVRGGGHIVLHDDSAGAAACARCTDSSFSTGGSPPDASTLGAVVWGAPSVPVQLLCPIQHPVQLTCSVGCSAADFLFGGDFSGHFTNVSVQLSDVCCSAGCAGDVVTVSTNSRSPVSSSTEVGVSL